MMEAMDAPFSDVLTDPAALAELYRPPSRLVMDKVVTELDAGCRQLIAASTFVLVGTSDAQGLCDVSPKGGPAGFVKVLDEHRLAIPDLNGNNRLDSLRNVLARPYVGLLFVVPGQGETLRVNGRAWVTTSADVLDRFGDELRRPTAAIGVAVDEAYLHCAKAFRRGGLWEPERWPDAADLPSVAEVLCDHVGMESESAPSVADALEQGYRRDLAADLPV